MKYNKNYPIGECAEAMKEIISGKVTNVHFHQKWTCAHCGVRQTMEEKNKFFHSGECEWCGKLTTILACNFLLVGDVCTLSDLGFMEKFTK